MAETRDVRLYIYNGNNPRGTGVTLTESRTIELETGAIAPVTNVDTSSTTKTETTIANIVYSSFEVTLVKLEYTKKIYEPCKIVAYLQMGIIQERTDVITQVVTTDADGKKSTSSKTDTGTYKPTKLIDNAKINLLKGAYVDLEIDKNKVAENYYVHKVRSVYKTISGKTSLFVELTIFSRDKLMTLDKYSRAYTAKRLYTDILSQEAEKFSSVEVANHMQLLKYKDSENSVDVTKRDELRIPYIVQYNESFYDFMVRAANRFGEFLYFEDGKLNLGMQPSETNYYRRNSNGNIVTEDDVEQIIDWATEPNAVQSRYYESTISEEIKVEERAYDYMSHDQYDDLDPLYGSDSDKRYNIDAVPMDDWTNQVLSKSGAVSGYVTQADLWQEEIKSHAVSFICRCLGFSSLNDFMLNLIYDFAYDAWSIYQKCHSFNEIIDNHTYDPIKNDDQKAESGDKFSQFTTFDGSTNLKSNLSSITSEIVSNFTESFYQAIRKKEKEIGEQAVWLDFGSNYKPIKLGDKLCINKKDYVVIQVRGSYVNNEEHLEVSAIPVEKLGNASTTSSSTTSTTTSSSSSTSSSTTTTADNDAWTDDLPIPPALPGVIVRDARPQVAFVAEMLDPEVLGRIRVRYPWQSKDDDMSPWIRVTLPLATSGGAVNFTPTVGDEVMVGYVHGNIDRPYAMGYVTAPFMNSLWGDSLPFDEWGAQHGIKVKTGHHLLFNDGANAAGFTASLIGGPFSWVKSIWPISWFPWPLGDAHSSDLGGGFELSDRYGIYKISGSTDERNVTIESPMGTVNMNAFQGITISAPNGDIKIEGKNVSISANNKLEITSGNTIKDRFYYQKRWEMSKWGTMFSSFASGGLDTLKSFRDDKFLDFGFIRCLVETFLRPVNGTLQIKSYTFVQIEAGTGATEVPSESLRKGDDSSINSTDVDKLQKINRTVSLINLNVKSLIEPIQAAYTQLYQSTMSFKKIIADDGINKQEKAIKYTDIITYAVGQDGNNNLPKEKFDFENTAQDLDLKDVVVENKDKKPDPTDTKTYKNGNQDPQYIQDYQKWEKKENAVKAAKTDNDIRAALRKEIIDTSEAVRIDARALYDAVGKWDVFAPKMNNFADNDVDKQELIDKIKALDFFGDIFKDLKKAALKNGSYDKDKVVEIQNMIWERQITGFTRYVTYQYVNAKKESLYKVGTTTFSDAQATLNNSTWYKYIKSIEDTEGVSLGKQALSSLVEYGKENVWNVISDNFRSWKHGFKGKILLSETDGKTASFDDNYTLKTKLNENVKSANLSALESQLLKM
jgi:hypothetical protein